MTWKTHEITLGEKTLSVFFFFLFVNNRNTSTTTQMTKWLFPCSVFLFFVCQKKKLWRRWQTTRCINFNFSFFFLPHLISYIGQNNGSELHQQHEMTNNNKIYTAAEWTIRMLSFFSIIVILLSFLYGLYNVVKIQKKVNFFFWRLVD